MAEYIERGMAIAKLTALEIAEPCATLTDARRLLADMPAADVAPVRHGRWKYNTDFQVWNCSECGENPHKGTGVVVAEENLPAYCPHCSARMEGAE